MADDISRKRGIDLLDYANREIDICFTLKQSRVALGKQHEAISQQFPGNQSLPENLCTARPC